MTIQKVTAITFSATGNSEKTALAIAKGMDGPVEEVCCSNSVFYPDKAQFGPDEAVVFCAPVYSGRIPRQALERLAMFRGDGTPAVVTVSFGNRDYDDALLELMDTVTANGFVPVAAGAFVGQHTFGTIAVGRPDAGDLGEAGEFGTKVARVLKDAADVREIGTPQVKGNRPYKPYGTAKFVPAVNADICTRCGICADKCPTSAIMAEDPSQPADGEKCMSCFRCVKYCPTGARNMDYEEYKQFAAVITERLGKDKKENQFIF